VRNCSSGTISRVTITGRGDVPTRNSPMMLSSIYASSRANAQFYIEVLGFTVKARDRIERSGLGVPIDLVYLDLGGTVVELISYEGVTVDPAPQTEHLGYRMMALEVDNMQKTADYLRKGVDPRLGSKGPRDLFKGGDLRPQRVPHRAQAVVPVSRCVHDRRAVEGASKIIYSDPPTSTKLVRVSLWV
jgi:Glyoxalase/Bleomycin resistance protein/Dioxygenase superfamily